MELFGLKVNGFQLVLTLYIFNKGILVTLQYVSSILILEVVFFLRLLLREGGKSFLNFCKSSYE